MRFLTLHSGQGRVRHIILDQNVEANPLVRAARPFLSPPPCTSDHLSPVEYHLFHLDQEVKKRCRLARLKQQGAKESFLSLEGTRHWERSNDGTREVEQSRLMKEN